MFMPSSTFEIVNEMANDAFMHAPYAPETTQLVDIAHTLYTITGRNYDNDSDLHKAQGVVVKLGREASKLYVAFCDWEKMKATILGSSAVVNA